MIYGHSPSSGYKQRVAEKLFGSGLQTTQQIPFFRILMHLGQILEK